MIEADVVVVGTMMNQTKGTNTMDPDDVDALPPSPHPTKALIQIERVYVQRFVEHATVARPEGIDPEFLTGLLMLTEGHPDELLDVYAEPDQMGIFIDTTNVLERQAVNDAIAEALAVTRCLICNCVMTAENTVDAVLIPDHCRDCLEEEYPWV